jgi:hypothetical protein
MTFGHSVDSKISVEMLRKIAGNVAPLTLEGYWVRFFVLMMKS